MSDPKRRPAVLWLWYRGEGFCGFQQQPGVPTVQQTLVDGLAAVGIAAQVMPSGRTDRGVHARMQVVSLRLPGDEIPSTLPARLAAVLPPTIGVARAAWAPRGFHAQWSAIRKEYRYRLAPGGPPAGWSGAVWSLPDAVELEGRTPDGDRLAEALSWMVGRRDFIAFHERSSPQKPRTLEHASLHRREGGGIWEVRLVGEAFARYMVRYLVGGAVAVASGVLPESRLRAALEHGEEIRGLKAPGSGLVLWEVGYPAALAPFGAEPPAGSGEPPPVPPFV